MEKTNRQVCFEKAYKDVHCDEDQKELLFDYSAEVEYNKKVGKYEVYIPSVSETTQAVIFMVGGNGFEKEEKI
jgi:hypothetical protein